MVTELHQTRKEEVDSAYPIKYFAERIPVATSEKKDPYDTIFELLELLAETKEISYFQAGFI
jgi:hypothetical protein